MGSGATARRHGRLPNVIDTGARLLDTTVLPAAVMPASAASMSRTLSCSRNEPGSWTVGAVVGARPFNSRNSSSSGEFGIRIVASRYSLSGRPIIADTSGVVENGASSPLEAETLTVEAQRAVHVGDRDAQADADDVAR